MCRLQTNYYHCMTSSFDVGPLSIFAIKSSHLEVNHFHFFCRGETCFKFVYESKKKMQISLKWISPSSEKI